MLIIFLRMDLRIQQFHDLHDGPCLVRPLGAVRHLFHLLHHGQDIPSILRHHQFFPFGIVEQFNYLIGSFHKDIVS